MSRDLRQSLNLILRNLTVSIIYFITARFGLLFDPVGNFATLVWPPSGISLALTLILGYWILPGVFLGALTANFASGAPLSTSVLIGIGNTLEAFVGAFLLKKIVKINFQLDSLKDVLALIILGAFFSTTISATLGTLALAKGQIIETNNFGVTWLAWWVGDMLGDLIIAPLILVFATNNELSFQKLRPSKVAEIFLLILSILVVNLIVFRGLLGIDTKTAPITYLICPPLIWASLAFGQRTSIVAVFFVSLIAIWGTVEGKGPFAQDRLSERLFFLQNFIGVVAITFLIMSAVMSERKRLEKLKDDFISITSHELRTPITIISAYIQMIKQKTQNQQVKLHTMRIEKQLNWLSKLIADLVDLTRIESRKLEFQYEIFSIKQLAREIIDDIQRSNRARKIIYLASGKGTVFADRSRITQVIINLISNAIKYSPKDGKIIVSLISHKKQILFSVQDFGVGINPQDQDQLFKRFFQSNVSSKLRVSGLGLGLYISSEIIKNHKGEIWVKSTPGKGSIFFFTLPIHKL